MFRKVSLSFFVVILFLGTSSFVNFAYANENVTLPETILESGNEELLFELNTDEINNVSVASLIIPSNPNPPIGTTYTVTDNTMRTHLISQGYSIPNSAIPQASGVTKIVYKGDGIWELWLSAFVLGIVIVGGAAAIGAIIALIPGIGWSVAGAVVSAIIAYIGTQTIKDGWIFRIKLPKGDVLWAGKQ